MTLNVEEGFNRFAEGFYAIYTYMHAGRQVM